MNREPTYYGILPAFVRYDHRLGMSEKVLYTEFAALTNKWGYATASNKYFADLYKTHTGTVSRWISKLVECGHIEIENEGKPNRRVKLHLSVTVPDVASQNDEGKASQNCDTNTTSLNKNNNTKSIITYYASLYEKKCGRKITINWGGWTKLINKLCERNTEEDVTKVIDYFFAWKDRTQFGFYDWYKKFDNLAPNALKTKPHPQGVKGWTCKKCGKINTHSGIICLGCQEERA